MFVVAANYVFKRREPADVPARVGTPTPSAPAPSAVADERPVLANSVAVLPFENMSLDQSNAYFADGVHEEVLNQLAKIKALNVIARASVLRYADGKTPIPEIARELHVQTVMRGSVRYAGDSVRITAQLIDPKTDTNLWEEVYQRKIDDIFAIQADIAMNIANALRAEFTHEEQRAIERPLTSSPEAYALYIEARAVIPAPGAAELRLGLLDRAIALDETFAAAYGLKAGIYATMFVNTSSQNAVRPERRADLDRRVRDNAARALALDPLEPSARAALQAANVATWRWSEFEHVEPIHAPATLLLGTPSAYAWAGDTATAVRFNEKFAELDPNNAGSYVDLGISYAFAGDRAASNRALSRALELAPAVPIARVLLALNATASGDVEKALADLRRVEQQYGEGVPTVYLPALAYAYSRIGRHDDARRLFGQIEAAAKEGDVGDGTWAVGYLAIGDEERALQYLERVAVEAKNHEPDAGQIAVMNLKMNVLADPRLESGRFKAALDRIHGY